MGESDVILNELKHINEKLEVMYEKYETRFDKFETKFEKFETKFEATKEKVDIMDGERRRDKWGIPIIISALSALFALIMTKAKGG